MRALNGLSPLRLIGDVNDDLGDDVATNQQLRDLDEKVEDIRSSIANMAVAQATAAGEVKVLATKFDGFEDRIEALEAARDRTDLRAWIERLVYGALGAALVQLAKLLHSGG